ncbi:MAG: hypothetical protein PHU03_05700 [Syntrophales bacterium]|nr:hypothetical protein [Syntrophales bacterium]
MRVLCSHCGYPNTIKKMSFEKPSQKFVCKQCGMETLLETGTIGSRRYDEDLTRQVHDSRAAPLTHGEDEEELSALDREEEREDESRRGLKIRRRFRTIVALMLLIAISGGISVFGSFYFRMKATEAVKTAETFIKESREIEAMAGKPAKIELTGIQFAKDQDGSRRVRLTMIVTGEDDSVTVVLYMKKNDDWTITDARYLDVRGGEHRLEVRR